ncbi:hypothetical protein PR202_gb26411 [Eleusine coracana subsp. coracana]|uniref:Uncharacterized protein n=1 Tax=Eleusine coracana subsp. coracana TaxID=191504 RepID=A0AAV5FP65_ELECO|nr:hypothetical protein PR202_gb26411 [Eleusine coracana subsp. coracana]
MPAAPSSGGGGGGQSSKVFFQCVRGSSNCGCPTGYGYGGYGGGSDCSLNVTDAYGITCPNCGDSVIRTLPLKYVSSGQNTFTGGGGGSASGFVQGVVTYTVKDDLTITPMSAISSIMLLNAFGVTDLTTLKEKTVKLGYVEGVQILRASLQSKTVLTDVFLGKEQEAFPLRFGWHLARRDRRRSLAGCL